MINVLLSMYNFDEPWIASRLKELIKPEHRVTIIPFSFNSHKIKNEIDFEIAYNPMNGKYYNDIIKPFLFYGIPEENIKFINYFKDDAKKAISIIENSDIVFLTGGLPDKYMDRLHKFNLEETLENFKGIMIGSSAGALIQLHEYHITPDEDYAAFNYYQGLNILNNFYIEVHYEGSGLQSYSIKKVLCEKRKPVYSIANDGGIIVTDGKVETYGNVDMYKIK